MNQKRYLELRRSLDLSADPNFLLRFGAQTLGIVFGAVALSVFFPDSSARLLAIPLISLLMFRSFAFMHEAVHGLLSKNTKLNHLLGVLSGTFCLLSYDSWRDAHLEHHRWSGNMEKDPVAAMVRTFPKFPSWLQSSLTFGWKCWIPTLSFLQHTVFWTITLRFAFKKKVSLGGFLSTWFPVFFWAALIWALPTSFLFSVLVPSVAFYLIGTEVINAPHHLGLEYFHGETKVPIWEQYKTARTCLYPRWLARFVVLNFNYHAEHHMFPYVPWYHLDLLHGVVRSEIHEGYHSDPSFAWVLTNRSRDLIDVFGSKQLTEKKEKKAA